MIDLSILVCSVSERFDGFAAQIQRQLYGQIDKLADRDRSRVEVIVLTDTRSMTIGGKRNHLVNMAAGKYVVFVDDDDEIADDYVESLLNATRSGADVLVFNLEYQFNGARKRVIRHSLRFTDDSTRGLNTPRHTSAVRRDIALALPFAETSYGEDFDWAQRLLSVAKTECAINKTLYIYRDCPATSVARQYAERSHPNAYNAWKRAQ
ncbi:glycosyltransferase [Mycobacterium sp. 1245801.1]|uniref:glycosyltransferase n=1 Tax=Mycobacterium sp. 1245801.1 TaxID=1834075 RepID=UPI000AEC0807|nr:glycosyltransferase [Mycobacterium sp. 1245801.1]